MKAPLLRLTPLARRHLARTLAWNNDPALMRLLNRAQLISAAEHEAWFQRLSGRTDCAYFAIEAGTRRKHVGNVWLWDIDARHRRCELRIVIGDPSAQGRGFGTQAIKLACARAATKFHLRRVHACVLAFNPRARQAFEKAGFQREGTLRQDRWSGDSYVDTWLMGKLL